MADTTLKVNPVAAGRILVHDEEARKAGFSPATPYFAVGTELVEVGRENFRQSRLKFDAMPPATEALEGLIKTVEQEQRQDHIVGIKDVSFLKDGRLFLVPNQEPVALTPHAFWQFLWRLSQHREIANPAPYLADIDPERRARILNEEVALSGDLSWKVRTRAVNGEGREAYAVVSPTYPSVDADRLAHTVIEQLRQRDADVRGSALYVGTRTKVDLLFHSDLAPKDVGVGEFYQAALRLTSDDDGTESVRWRTMLARAICINLTTVTSEQTGTVRRHAGQLDTMLQVVAEGLNIGWGQLKFFIAAFQAKTKDDARVLAAHAKGRKFPDRLTPDPIIRHIFDGEHRLWAVTGASPDAIATAVADAWLKEPADWSVAGLANAVSRAAHEAVWPTSRIEETLEDRAGQLVTSAAVPWGWKLKEVTAKAA